MPGSRGGIWLPQFGSSPQTALSQFVIRTALRSRRHRAIQAFHLGGGSAIVAVYLEGARQSMHLTGGDIVHRVNVPMLVASVLILCASWLGARTVFSLPLDLRANWIFRVTPAPGSAASLSAVRRALLAVSLFPVWAASAALLFWFWPWATVAGHLLILGLLGSLLADLSLRGFRKIPFTCSYLPGKSKVHMLFWFGVIAAHCGDSQCLGTGAERHVESAGLLRDGCDSGRRRVRGPDGYQQERESEWAGDSV